MLGFFHQSHEKWYSNKGLALPTYVSAFMAWQWMVKSTILRDFAMDVLEDPSGEGVVYWTMAALINVMDWNQFMACEGKVRNVPHLWAYFCLSLILPISFTQNYFFLAVLLGQLDAPGKEPSELNSAITPTRESMDPTELRYFLCTVLFNLYLMVLGLRPQRSFVPLSIAFRLILLVPLFIEIPNGYPAIRTGIPSIKGINSSRPLSDSFGVLRKDFVTFTTIMMATLLTMALAYMPVALFMDVPRVFGSVNVNPAIRAVGYDFLISMASNIA
ncbi:hypothetical protein H2201_006895 [Coniosporium apollinis]|uniref:Alpha-1,3-glucosyltransferase n=1 Tax=Coniosporium apollinis TaxID=61459 RepID=A0ABQ9NMZ5_9PEZI|nr:hypothetical protein H2201_006895 [Coniosporium apollinis]